MSQPLYTLFKRTGAYTLFKDESEMERTNVGDTALHVIVGQSRYGNAPINTLVRLQDTSELFNTFGTRDRYMERRGNYLIPYANILLSQGPVFVLNLRKFDDTKHKVDNISVKPAKDAKFVFDSNKQVPIQSIYDRTGFWKVDKELIQENIKDDALLMFSTFNSKSGSIIITKADMSLTEFGGGKTVADYNAQHPRNPIENLPGEFLLADLFYKVDVFASRLANDLATNFNPALSEFLAMPVTPTGLVAGTGSGNDILGTGTDGVLGSGAALASGAEPFTNVLGTTAAEQAAKLAGLIALRSSNYLQSYTGCIIPDVVSTMGDKVSIADQFNNDSKIHGMVASFNEELLEDWALNIDNGDPTAIKAYFDQLLPTSGGNPVAPQVIDLKGSDTTDDQFIDGTAAKQNELLDLLTTRGLKSSLTAYKKNDYAYILDSFKSYLQANDKWQIAKLALDTKRISYLYSTPFMKDFTREKTYQDDNGVFDAKFIPQGGNPSVQDKVLYSMPGDGFGDIATFPFAGGFIYDDGGKQIAIPGSIAGAIAYGAKHISAIRKPYSIVNGPINGLVNMPYVTDVDYEFTDYDLDWLEPFGWNCNLKSGTVFEIRNDATAKNIVKSSLSYASNYELITYIAREGRKVLEPLIGERNNPVTRLRAKQGVDAICNRLRAEGVIETYTNTCDLTNNTLQLRKQGFLVLDTVIVTADGIRIAVHQIDVKLTNDVANIVLEDQ
ncbi:tail sheath protein [Chryseobacterium phage MA9V-1]|nr:tail sheath protein [Chryseobacterium phage MA9V-1]